MKPFPHQLHYSDVCWDILKELGYVYLAGKPRSGKTLTSILVAEKSDKISSVLVLTKKAAISGWEKFTTDKELNLQHKYTITNYEQAHKLKSSDYQLVIIDESHNLGTLGKPSKRIKTIQKLCYDMPHINLSGTAIVESPNSIYHQMTISKFTPFEHKNFYDYFREFGKPYYIKAGGREITQYDKCDMELLMPIINSFTVYMTQEDAGIDKSLQATDKCHYVELCDDTKALYNELQEHNIVRVGPNILEGLKCEVCGLHLHKNEPELKCPGCGFNYNYELVADSVMKLRVSLHMLESGVAKIDDEYIMLGNTEKIDYIKETFKDDEDTGIMCHFIGEQLLLKKHFKNAQIYSSSAHAEGVDLSHLKNFVILSSDYSGSKFIQRRDRVINTNGSNTTTVHHILVKGAISEQVYKRVSKKEDFNNSTYIEQRI